MIDYHKKSNSYPISIYNFVFAMFNKKKSNNIVKTIIAKLLLAVFLTTLVPIDILHHHQTEEKCLKTLKTICQHKTHFKTKSAHCSICAIHFEKTFLFQQITIRLSRINVDFTPPLFYIHASKTLHHYFQLRAPPFSLIF